MTVRTITDVACTVCGCVCDDLSITVDGDQIVDVANGCKLADPWFPARTRHNPPAAMIGDKVATLSDATARAAAILSEAKCPLIYGLARSTTDGQRAAVALAERLGATIDTSSDTSSIVAMQQVGASTCTLGEVRNRADLVIFWGSDPVTTHPRHLERYSRPAGKPRTLIVVDAVETATSKEADLFVQVDEARNWETLWTLRLHVAGKIVDAPPALVDLAARIKACNFGVVFFGAGLTHGALAHRTVEALLQLVTDLNAHTRFYARHMRQSAAGAESVLTWQTGYPFGVNFATGAPCYNPGEFTGTDMLGRKEIDACLLIGSDGIDELPDAALEHLNTIPVIRLDSPGTSCDVKCDVCITTAVYGIHTPGTAHRMDDVMIPLTVLVPTEYPGDAEVIAGIERQLDQGSSTAS